MCAVGVLPSSRVASAPASRRTGVTILNDDVGQQILRDQQDMKTDVKTLALSMNALNTEVAKMSVKLELLSSLQQSVAEQGHRITKLETELAGQERNAQRVEDLKRWVIVFAVGTFLSMGNLVFQIFSRIQFK